MTPIRHYLETWEAPNDKVQVRKQWFWAINYVFQHGELYWKSYLQLLLKCVGPIQDDYISQDFHEACHQSCWLLVNCKKILWWGVLLANNLPRYIKLHLGMWPMPKIPPIIKKALSRPNPIQEAWPIAQWGIDIIEPFLWLQTDSNS